MQKSKKGPERARTRQRAHLWFYETEPSRYDGLSFVAQKKINVKFPKTNTKIEEKWNISAKR